MKYVCLIHLSVRKQRNFTEHKYHKHRPRKVPFLNLHTYISIPHRYRCLIQQPHIASYSNRGYYPINTVCFGLIEASHMLIHYTKICTYVHMHLYKLYKVLHAQKQKISTEYILFKRLKIIIEAVPKSTTLQLVIEVLYT